MPIAVQHRRGTTTQLNSFTGVEGEFCFDTSRATIRVFDGVQLGGYELAALHRPNLFEAGQRSEVIFASSGSGTYTINLALSNNFELSLTGNITLDFSNLGNGQAGVVVFKQDSGGGRTVAYATKVLFPGGAAPTASPGGNAISVLGYTVQTSSSILANMLLDFS